MISYLLFLLFFLIIFTAFWGAISAAPYIPTRKKDVERMISLAEVKASDKVYDLGCGDGRLIFAAAKIGAQAIGIEIFFLPYLYARLKSYFNPRTEILFGDMFNFDISNADVVFIFLMNKSYQKLAKKLKQELKPGSRIVSSCWPIKGWEDKLKKVDKPDNKTLPLYLYII